MKKVIADVGAHYDLLIEENNDPVRDPVVLQEYMDLWDGQLFLEMLELNPSKSVLEIGVGTGRLAVRTAPCCRHLTGIDMSAKTIERAQENLREYPNISLICNDFLTHSFSETFDVIYSSLTMMHFPDKALVIGKMSSLLNDDGILCISIDKN
ncbi:MAG: class I SAM-dependent methyltransferase, partial [Lachnospiraceae bacterium]|nr:class I SAM-dependent methyltransferase [Lachnospiraceae bacterium]